MARKDIGRKIYRSMQGKQVDMDLLRKRNELTPAVGNARVNARGDVLGPGGKILENLENSEGGEEQSKKNSILFINNYFPVQFGFLFSEKARGPSIKSSLLNKLFTESYFADMASSISA